MKGCIGTDFASKINATDKGSGERDDRFVVLDLVVF